MNKTQLVDKVSRESELSRGEAERALDSLITVISSAVSDGEEVRIAGFGMFRPRPPGVRRSPVPAAGLRAMTGMEFVSDDVRKRERDSSATVPKTSTDELETASVAMVFTPTAAASTGRSRGVRKTPPKVTISSDQQVGEPAAPAVLQATTNIVRLRGNELEALLELYYSGGVRKNLLTSCAVALRAGQDRPLARTVAIPLRPAERETLLGATKGRRPTGFGALIPLLKDSRDHAPVVRRRPASPPPLRPKASAKKVRKKRAHRSVWTVGSAGLPSLGKRR